MWYLKNFDELSKKEVIEIYKARIQTFIVEQQLNYQEIDEIDKRAWHLFETDENGNDITYIYDQTGDECVLWFMAYHLGDIIESKNTDKFFDPNRPPLTDNFGKGEDLI